jgi:hypothetical protein
MGNSRYDFQERKNFTGVFNSNHLPCIGNFYGIWYLLICSIRLQLVRPHLFPRTTSITLVYDLLPTQWRGRVLDVLDGWEVVFILLHGRDPWYVVKGHDLHTEVFIVLDLLNFGEEGRQVGSRDVVHVCDEVGRRELMTWSVRYSQDN